MKPVVIPLGVETPPLGKADCLLAELPPLGADLRVVFLSRLDPKKNLEGLIGAIGLLHRAGMPVTVLVGGSGEPDYVARLQALATTEGVGSRIHWLGPVSGNRKADLLAAGEVFILPSFSENFGIAAVEALAIGLPCVLGRGVAIAAEVEAAGAGVSVAPDPEAIAAALRLCICDKAWRNSASVLGRQLAEREYSVDRMGERLVQLYRRVSPHG